jgi:hypothetical protein
LKIEIYKIKNMKTINIFKTNKPKHNSSPWGRLGGVGVFILLTFTFSCSDYLDVVPDNIPTVDHAFSSRYEAQGFLYGCFSQLPAFADASQNPAFLGGDEVWFISSSNYINSRLWNLARGSQGTNTPIANYWASKQDSIDLIGGKPLFTALSDCNIFLENIHKPYDLREDERIRWIAEVKFVKAYMHFWLFRMYGPIPLIKENLPLSAKNEEAQRSRESVDEVVDYIVSLLEEAIPDLPYVIEDKALDMGRPTKAIALAVKAQVLTLAASPLFNGNPDYASFKDTKGISLFPQSYDAGKWKKAADACLAAILMAENPQSGHKLYNFKETSAVNISILDSTTIAAMQVRGAATEKWNPEIIWGDPNNNPNNIQACCFPLMADGFIGNMTQTYAPPFHIVEQFYTNHGIPIEEDESWTGKDKMAMRTSVESERFLIQQNQQTIQLHFDREARFYGAICFDKGIFYGSPQLTNPTALINNFVNSLAMPGNYCTTGYLCKKLINILSSGTASLSMFRYAFPVIRLGDLYLLYAETLNEAGGATPDADVYKYIDIIRARTGLEGVKDSWAKYAIASAKTKPLTQEGMREIIHRERLNELAFEGSRFWDLRRWKLAEEYINGRVIKGFNVFATTPSEFYGSLDNVYTLKFEKKDYLWPIRQSVLLNNQNLVQNPGWR